MTDDVRHDAMPDEDAREAGELAAHAAMRLLAASNKYNQFTMMLQGVQAELAQAQQDFDAALTAWLVARGDVTREALAEAAQGPQIDVTQPTDVERGPRTAIFDGPHDQCTDTTVHGHEAP